MYDFEKLRRKQKTSMIYFTSFGYGNSSLKNYLLKEINTRVILPKSLTLTEFKRFFTENFPLSFQMIITD